MSFPLRFLSPAFKSTAYRFASGIPFSSLVITLSSSDTVSSGLVSSEVVPSSLVTSEEDSVCSSLASSEEASVCSSLASSEEASVCSSLASSEEASVCSSLASSEEASVCSSLASSEEASVCSSLVTSEEASFVISSAFMFIENIVLESCNVDNAKTSTAARTERIFILFILVFLPKMCFYWHSVCADTSCIISLIEIAVLR